MLSSVGINVVRTSELGGAFRVYCHSLHTKELIFCDVASLLSIFLDFCINTCNLEIMKLLENSSYGKTLTNISNHYDVTFLNDADNKKKMTNSPLLKNLTPLVPDWNEVESKKASSEL